MSEKYTKLFSLPEQTTRHDLHVPVEVVAGALLKDNQSGRVLAQIKYKNISNKSIKSISVNIMAKDARGADISGVEDYVYNGLIAAQDDVFGDKTPVFMADNNANSFSVDIVSVEFSDGSKWNKLGEQAVKMVKEKVTVKNAIKTASFIINTVVFLPMIITTIGLIKDIPSIEEPELAAVMKGFTACFATATGLAFPAVGVMLKKRWARILRWVAVIFLIIAGAFVGIALGMMTDAVL